MAEKVGSASHLHERKGGSSWKLNGASELYAEECRREESLTPKFLVVGLTSIQILAAGRVGVAEVKQPLQDALPLF